LSPQELLLGAWPAAGFEPRAGPSVEPATIPVLTCYFQMSPRTESFCGSRRNRVITAAACVSVNIPSDRQLSLKPHVSVMWAGVS
jgi:hypothetical protein